MIVGSVKKKGINKRLYLKRKSKLNMDLSKDEIVEAVRDDLLKRSMVGIEKYKITLDKETLPLKDWLIHAYHECLDQANYLKRAIVEIERTENS